MEKEPAEDAELKDPLVFCMQAQHAGTRTYYFSADSHEEQKEWIKAMNEAAEVNIQQTQRCSSLTASYTHTHTWRNYLIVTVPCFQFAIQIN